MEACNRSVLVYDNGMGSPSEEDTNQKLEGGKEEKKDVRKKGKKYRLFGHLQGTHRIC